MLVEICVAGNHTLIGRNIGCSETILSLVEICWLKYVLQETVLSLVEIFERLMNGPMRVQFDENTGVG